MARHLIQNATTGETRIVGDAALAFFPGYVVMDTLEDGQPPTLFYSGGESDLRYVNVSEISDTDSAASVALRAASRSLIEDEDFTPTGAWNFTGATVTGIAGGAGDADDVTKSNLRKFVAVGDSLTGGNQDATGFTYPILVNAALGNVAVVNLGLGGATSTEEAIRFGAIDPVLGAFTIAADTSAVSVTVTSPTGSYRTGVTLTHTYTGTVNGIAGQLKEIISGGSRTWTFQRTTAGSATPVAAGSTFHSTAGDAYRDHLALIWVGRNNVTAVDTVLADIDAIVDRLSPTVKRFVVLGVPTSSTETTGTQGHTDVTALNTALASAYGDQFVDVQAALLAGLSLVNVTATGDDTTALSNGTVPPSLQHSDLFHLNANGYRVVADAVTDRLEALGWTRDPVSPVPGTGPQNLLPDPSFEANTATVVHSSGSMVGTRTTAAARTGATGLRVTFTGTVSAPRTEIRVVGTLSPSTTPYSSGIWVRPSKNAYFKPRTMILNGSTIAVGDSTAPGQVCPAGVWTWLSLQSVLTNAGDGASCAIESTGVSWGTSDYYDIDDARLVAGTVEPPR